MPEFALVVSGPDLNDADLRNVGCSLDAASPPSARPLWPGRAGEFIIDIEADKAAERLRAARARVEGRALDVNLVGADTARRKQLLIADMDSTIIEQECIDELADLAGHGAAVAAMTERAMRGELNFEEALKARVGLLKGLETAALNRVIEERLSLSPGARALIQTMRAHGAYTALVSGGFTFFTSRIAAKVGFHENRANTLGIAAERLTGTVEEPILGRQAKLDTLRDLIKTRSIAPEATIAVGDGANDLAMIQAAGLGVAYHAKPVVAAEASARLDHDDLTGLLFLQGYCKDEIVE